MVSNGFHKSNSMKHTQKFLPAFIWLLCICSFHSNGQAIKNFTGDPVKFAEEMRSFIEETDRKEGEKVMDEFEKEWTANKFTPVQHEAIYRTANAML